MRTVCLSGPPPQRHDSSATKPPTQEADTRRHPPRFVKGAIPSRLRCAWTAERVTPNFSASSRSGTRPKGSASQSIPPPKPRNRSSTPLRGNGCGRHPKLISKLIITALAEWLLVPIDRLTLRDASCVTLATHRTCADLESSARHVGISASRLRTLAREQLGVSLSTWMLWRKLERAARAVLDGEPLARAAALGGFSDQAHFTRTMRRMFGVTPRAATRHVESSTDVR